MKYLSILVVFVLLVGCKERKSKFDISLEKIDSSLQRTKQTLNSSDTAMQKLKTSIRFLDSNLKYGRMAKEMEIKMSESKADYYRTEDEKYYRRFYKYRDLQWKYVGLANQYYDSSHAIK